MKADQAVSSLGALDWQSELIILFIGLALDLPLLKWLERYTFPTEAKFADVSYAKRVYEQSVEATIANGTTCDAYHATIHRQSTEVLCDIIEEKGQRALVGKVNTNFNDH